MNILIVIVTDLTNCLLGLPERAPAFRKSDSQSCFEHCQDNLEMILHEFVLENVETELLRKWKNQS